MSYIPSLTYRVQGTLSADVANAATFTVAYPTGKALANFDAGLYKEGSGQVILNGSTKWTDSASGIAVTTFGASTITLTNNTGATIVAGTTYDVGLSVWASPPEQLVIPIFALAGVSAADVVSGIRPGIDGYITDMQFVTGAPVTTAAKAATLTPKINTTLVTGAAVALTSANCTPLGARVAGSRATAGNRITKADSLSIVGSAVTAFLEGSGYLIIRFQPDVL